MAAARYDAIVIGLGGMGSAAAFHLATRGQRVLGLEQFGLLHDRGSSHGLTRIIRLAYHEHPSYVPLLRRSYDLWRELEELAGEQLLVITGCIEGGPEDGPMFRGSLAAAEQHGLPHEVLDAAELRRRYPAYGELEPSTKVVLQPDGGFLLAERSLLAHVNQALLQGADLHFHEPVLSWEPTAQGGVNVVTERATYEADRLVICAGPWAGRMVPRLASVARPERQVLGWFQPRRPELFTPERFPVFVLDMEDASYYGFPVYDSPGFKVGRYHHLREPMDPDDPERATHPEDEAILRAFATRAFPDGAGQTILLKACIFTNSPDEHFIIDLLPDTPQVSVAAGFSGHGYKFCSLVGEVMADLAIDRATRHDIGLFKLSRLPA
ncbi:MAG TPA: N-methyl-L-tryptophan oxidase [Candidatus Limnocylindria bacterium]|jgi:sarcosine oxidase|nr:N-methyl-L-tryptophan oxidase [Candidatus Limnocylindria bacterium]